jgi:hypothetical protein
MLRILSDVARCSREYNTFRQEVASQAQYDTGLEIELDKIVDRVRQTNSAALSSSSHIPLSPPGSRLKPHKISSQL